MRIIKSQLILLIMGVSIAGCASDDCNEPKTLEVSQAQFMDELLSVNGLSVSDVKYSTRNDVNCQTRYIYELAIENKTLKIVPSSIVNLKYLRDLWLFNDGLDSLPESLMNLTYLELYVDSNSICNVTAAMDSFLNKKSLTWSKTQKCP